MPPFNWPSWATLLPSSVAWARESILSKPSLLITAAVIAIVSLVEWQSTTAIIDDFEISSELSREGVTPSMVSYALDAKLREIQAVAGTAMQIEPLSLSKPPQFVVPGTGISLGFMIEQVKRFFSIDQLRVGGAILTLKGQLQTVVRIEVSDKGRKIYGDSFDKTATSNCSSNQSGAADPGTNGWPELNAQLSCTAEFILKYTQPYILAVYNKEIGNTKTARDLALFIRYHPPSTDEHWALNLLGSIASDEARQSKDAAVRDARIKEAESYFQQSEAAYEALKKTRSVPPFVLTYVNRAVLDEHQKKYDLAENQYRRAIQNDPYYGIAYSNLAGILVRQASDANDEATKSKLWKDANDNYQKGSVLAKDLQQKAIVLTGWARSLSSLKQYPEALEKLNLATAAHSAHAEAYFLKGEILQKASDQNSQEILDAFSTAARLKPWNSGYAIKYATVLSENNRLEESLVEFERIVKREPANIYVINQYANTLAGTIKERPSRYPLAFEKFYQAYDLTAKSNSKAGPPTDIEERIWPFVRLYLKAIAETAGTNTDINKARQTILLDAGDRFLRGGHVFANTFYSEAVRFAPAGKTREDLIDLIIGRLGAAAKNSTNAKRAAIIDLAWQYKRADEGLLIEKFMTLVISEKFDDARSFASQWCGGKKDFEATVRGRLDASWNCSN